MADDHETNGGPTPRDGGPRWHQIRSRALVIAAFLLATTVVWAPVDAQQVPKAKIGLLAASTPASAAFYVEAFKQSLRDLGHVEGTTFVLETRYAEGNSERLPGRARELVGLKPNVIVTVTDVATAAVKRETRTIPIVMVASSDPVGTGFVASLAHPSGNVTGFSSVSSELTGKRLELLRQAISGLVRVAVLWNPDVRGAVLDYKEAEAAARSLRLGLQAYEVSNPDDLDRAFSVMITQRAQAMILLATNSVTFSRRAEIATLAQRNRLPSVFQTMEYVSAGGLMSYGPSISVMLRRAAIYVDKILKGAKPADLPVEEPTKFELVINLKTAKTLGLTMPPSLLQRANQLIQ
jgi:putative tryptophan/tyrosine transport system substrate-binding protein